MKISHIISYFALGASAAYALPTKSVDDTISSPDNAVANLPGLDMVQSKYANAIIAQAKKNGVGAHGCQAGIATAMVEVGKPHHSKSPQL